MKKIFTIKIIKAYNPNIWYAGKVGQEFEAEKLIRYNGKMGMCIKGVLLFFVNETDYEVLKSVVVNNNHLPVQSIKFNLAARLRSLGWAEKQFDTIRCRIKHGWPVDRAISTPIRGIISENRNPGT